MHLKYNKKEINFIKLFCEKLFFKYNLTTILKFIQPVIRSFKHFKEEYKKGLNRSHTSRAGTRTFISCKTISIGRTSRTCKQEASKSSLNCCWRTETSLTNFENSWKLFHSLFLDVLKEDSIGLREKSWKQIC